MKRVSGVMKSTLSLIRTIKAFFYTKTKTFLQMRTGECDEDGNELFKSR